MTMSITGIAKAFEIDTRNNYKLEQSIKCVKYYLSINQLIKQLHYVIIIITEGRREGGTEAKRGGMGKRKGVKLGGPVPSPCF